MSVAAQHLTILQVDPTGFIEASGVNVDEVAEQVTGEIAGFSLVTPAYRDTDADGFSEGSPPGGDACAGTRFGVVVDGSGCSAPLLVRVSSSPVSVVVGGVTQLESGWTDSSGQPPSDWVTAPSGFPAWSVTAGQGCIDVEPNGLNAVVTGVAASAHCGGIHSTVRATATYSDLLGQIHERHVEFQISVEPENLPFGGTYDGTRHVAFFTRPGGVLQFEYDEQLVCNATGSPAAMSVICNPGQSIGFFIKGSLDELRLEGNPFGAFGVCIGTASWEAGVLEGSCVSLSLSGTRVVVDFAIEHR
jgi:hypothetical protein